MERPVSPELTATLKTLATLLRRELAVQADRLHLEVRCDGSATLSLTNYMGQAVAWDRLFRTNGEDSDDLNAPWAEYVRDWDKENANRK